MNPLALALLGFVMTLAPQEPALAPGVHSEIFRRAGQPMMRYSIYVPKGYTGSTPVPLIIALHYGGNPSGAGDGVLRMLVGPALLELGAIIVAPDSLGGGWDIPVNEVAVMALLDSTLQRFNIDKKKVVVTGFSMGGAGVWHLAGKYPERFSAAIPVAGRPGASPQGWRTPVLAIHSRDDGVVPIGPAEARIRELQKAGVRAEFIELRGIAHYETDRFVDGLRRAVPWLRETWK
jgi:predicted peptidase